jgi:hypothetical protein
VAQPQEVLTQAVRCVFQRTPQQLPWQQPQHDSTQLASLEAVAPDNSLYSINVLKGTVLLDGYPAGRLEDSITGLALFRYAPRAQHSHWELLVLHRWSHSH